MTTKSSTKSNPLFVILLASWGLILAIAFLSNRGTDIGQLGTLADNLRGPLFGAGFADSLAGIGISLLLGLSWIGLGRFLVSILGLREKSEPRPQRPKTKKS